MGKWEIRPTVKSYPLKYHLETLHTWLTSARLPAMQILVSLGKVGASSQIGEILAPCDFFVWLSCPVLTIFFSIMRPGRIAGPIFTLYGLYDVFPRKDSHFWG